MALVLADRVQEITTTSGTGTLTLNGAVPGFQDFVTGIGSGNTTYYTLYDPTTYEWEVGIGTFTSGGTDTLSRDTVLSNSLGTTAKINLAGNQTNVFVTYPSEKSVNLNAAGVAEIGEPISYADTGLIATFASTEAGYNQVVVQNKSTAINASANLNVSNDASSSTDGFAELGINSSTFSNGPGCFNIPNAAYVASSGADLSIGTYNAYDIHFATNSSTTDAMTIFDNGGTSLGGYGNPGIGNLALNKVVSGVSNITSAGGTTVLNAASTYYQRVIGTTTQTIQLPDATTLLNGTTFIVDNDSTSNVTVTDFATASLDVIPAGGLSYLYLIDNSTVAGTWTAHGYLPSIYNFNNTVADFGNATITNAVWNGNTIAYNYGGTGLTTFGGANNALYSTSASTLTAGTLPVAAGGTGLTSLTANYIPYGNGTSAYQSSATFTYNGTTLTASNYSTGGNLTFTGTGNRITGDFSNATVANRVAFQTSTTNGSTTIMAIPNGTGPNTQLLLRGSATLTDDAFGQVVLAGGSDFRLASGASGTGTYLPMTFYTGGSERMRVDTSGNVGIGTNSPSALLDVNGNLAITGSARRITGDFSNATASNRPIIQSSTTNGATYVFSMPNGTGVISGFYSANNSDVNNSSYMAIRSNATEASLISSYAGTGTYLPMTFYTGGSERVRIDSSGNVGIGTSSPGQKLDISTTSSSALRALRSTAGQVAISVTSTLDTTELGKFADGNSYLASNGAYPLALWTNGSERMRIDSVGRVAIGTSSPGSATTFTVKAGDSAGTNPGTGVFYKYFGTAASPTESLDWPTPVLCLRGFGNFTQESMLSFGYSNDADYQTSNAVWAFRLDGVASATTSSASTHLRLVGPGTFYVDTSIISGGTVTANSDERYKHKWESLSTDFVTNLATVKSGTYEKIDNEQRQAGVSAQSLQKLLPEAVVADKEGMLSVAYGNAALVSAIELAKEVVKLKELVNDLQSQLEDIKRIL